MAPMRKINSDDATLLGSADVAHLLGLSRAHVNYLARTGELPWAQRLGPARTSAYLFRRVDVEQYAVEHLPVPPIHQQATLDEPVLA